MESGWCGTWVRIWKGGWCYVCVGCEFGLFVKMAGLAICILIIIIIYLKANTQYI